MRSDVRHLQQRTRLPGTRNPTPYRSYRDAVDEEEDETRFIPSVLDASVRYAHGRDNTGERELIKMQEEAQRLEEQQEK